MAYSYRMPCSDDCGTMRNITIGEVNEDAANVTADWERVRGMCQMCQEAYDKRPTIEELLKGLSL